MEFVKKKVVVVGLGKSGIAAARWLSKAGAEVTVSEIKTDLEIQAKYRKELMGLGVHLESGGHREETFIHADLIIMSPGVPLDIEPLQAAQKSGVPILGEMALAVGLVDIPIVAVSGTNGKSTTVTLIGDMLKTTGARVFVGGNIGNPLMDYVVAEEKTDYAVLEVSSFQLDTMVRFSPKISLLLNISPDHLDRYPDYEAYVQSKRRICRDQGPGQYVVLNDDDEQLSRFMPEGGVSVLRYGLKDREGRHAFLNGNTLIARWSDREIAFAIDQYALPGRHNLENLLGSTLAALAMGATESGIQDAIIHFKGLPHRLEPVGRIDGVTFINDSKATNVDSAVRSVTSFDRPVILIAGGRHKGGDYSPLVLAAKGRVKKIVLLGEARDLMADAFKDVIPIIFTNSMEEAVSKAFSSAGSNDVVLLAPACSSFDMFKDYADRGNRFKQAVKGLDHGRQ